MPTKTKKTAARKPKKGKRHQPHAESFLRIATALRQWQAGDIMPPEDLATIFETEANRVRKIVR